MRKAICSTIVVLTLLAVGLCGLGLRIRMRSRRLKSGNRPMHLEFSINELEEREENQRPALFHESYRGNP